MKKDKTFFGFKEVNIEDKTKLVGSLFSSVSKKYDLMNDIMSFGIHRLWKDEFCSYIPSEAKDILDVAGGTGDIAIRSIMNRKGAKHVTICDINLEMIAIARNKAMDKGIFADISYIQGDAENLPFADESFDCYTIAFGIRNVTNIEKALSESFRVLKPGGKFLCLEFSKPECAATQKIYDFYSFNIIPQFGKIVANNEDGYRYLAESINKFPDQETFKNMIEKEGYSLVNYKNLTGGIAAIHWAYKC